jgi:predicted transcriptional regulator
MIKINKNILSVIEHISNRGSITKDDKPDNMDIITFYITLWNLRDMGIIMCYGKKDNKKKIWGFTEKGKKLSKFIDDFKKIIGD